MNNAASLFPALASPASPSCLSPSPLGTGAASLAQPSAAPTDSFGDILADALPAQQTVQDAAGSGAGVAFGPATPSSPRGLGQKPCVDQATVEPGSRNAAQPNWGKSVEVLTAKIKEQQQQPGWSPQGLVRRLPELFPVAPDSVPVSSGEPLDALPVVTCPVALSELPTEQTTAFTGAKAGGLLETGATESDPELQPCPVNPGEVPEDADLESPAPLIPQVQRPGASPARPLSTHAAAGLSKAIAQLQSNPSSSLGRQHPLPTPAGEGRPASSTELPDEGIEEVDTGSPIASEIPAAASAAATVGLQPLPPCDPALMVDTSNSAISPSQAQGSVEAEALASEGDASSGTFPGSELSPSTPSTAGHVNSMVQHWGQQTERRRGEVSLASNKPEFAASGSDVTSLDHPLSYQGAGTRSLPAHDNAAEAARSATRPEGASSRVEFAHPISERILPASQSFTRTALPTPLDDTRIAAEPVEGMSVPATETAATPADSTGSETQDLSIHSARQGGAQARNVLNPASNERHGIPFVAEDGSGKAHTGQPAEAPATQAQALAHASARSAVMRSYGVPAKGPSRDFNPQTVEVVPSTQMSSSDSSSASAAVSAVTALASSGTSSRGAVEQQSTPTQPNARQDGEKSAPLGFQSRASDSFARASSKEKSAQAIGAKIEANAEKAVGIDDAKKSANMNSAPSSTAISDVAQASRSTMDWVAEGLSRLGSGDSSTSALAQSDLAPHAKQLVERVEKALESLQSRPERVVRFDVGDSRDERLSVSLQLRDGVIHTTFAAGSSELRDLISREWSSSLGSSLGADAGLRVAEPVFTTASRNENLDTGSQSQRQQQQPGQQGHASAPQGQSFHRAALRSTTVAAPESATQPAHVASSSHRVLQAFA